MTMKTVVWYIISRVEYVLEWALIAALIQFWIQEIARWF